MKNNERNGGKNLRRLINYEIKESIQNVWINLSRYLDFKGVKHLLVGIVTFMIYIVK